MDDRVFDFLVDLLKLDGLTNAGRSNLFLIVLIILLQSATSTLHYIGERVNQFIGKCFGWRVPRYDVGTTMGLVGQRDAARAGLLQASRLPITGGRDRSAQPARAPHGPRQRRRDVLLPDTGRPRMGRHRGARVGRVSTPRGGIIMTIRTGLHPDTCEWGGCTEAATTTVTYPGIVPGTAGRERSADLVRLLSVCESCRPVAQAEADDMYAELARQHQRKQRTP